MMPCRSTAVPIMNPGTSARNSNGMLKASQSQMKRAALSAESTKRMPPLCLGWVAGAPTPRPAVDEPVQVEGASLVLGDQRVKRDRRLSLDRGSRLRRLLPVLREVTDVTAAGPDRLLFPLPHDAPAP